MPSLILRTLLVPAALLGVFALGLVHRQDLDKLSAIQLRWGPLRRVRDSVVGVAAYFARAVEPVRAR